MSEHPALAFDRRPSTLAFMLRSLHYAPGLKRRGRFPELRLVWRGARIDRGELAGFLNLTGLDAASGVPMLFLHVLGFPMLMATLTHPRFPIPLWHALQVRNLLLQHRPVGEGAVLEIETRVAGQRILERGAEVDLHTTMREQGNLVWESLVTFYYRGGHGAAGVASPLATAPQVEDVERARWRTSPGVGLRLAGWTGDYNPIHLADWYARRSRFERAFHHPQLLLGQCMAHLPAPATDDAQRLDAWLKGPVYYGNEVTLRAGSADGGMNFSLTQEGETRPAMVGRWRSCAAGSSLADGD